MATIKIGRTSRVEVAQSKMSQQETKLSQQELQIKELQQDNKKLADQQMEYFLIPHGYYYFHFYSKQISYI